MTKEYFLHARVAGWEKHYIKTKAKKAHMTEMEVNANDVETESLSDMMYDSIKEGLENANKRFGLNIGIRKRYGSVKDKLSEDKEDV